MANFVVNNAYISCILHWSHILVKNSVNLIKNKFWDLIYWQDWTPPRNLRFVVFPHNLHLRYGDLPLDVLWLLLERTRTWETTSSIWRKRKSKYSYHGIKGKTDLPSNQSILICTYFRFFLLFHFNSIIKLKISIS